MATQTVIRSSSQLWIDANLDFHSKKGINLAPGTINGDAVEFGQMQTAISTAVLGLGNSIHTPVQDLAGAIAIPAIERQDKMIMLIESLGLYHFDSQSTDISNNGSLANVIRPTDIATDAGAGRWIKMSNVMTDHNSLTTIQGGNGSTEYYHLTALEYTGTGSGVFARKTSPIFITPNIGAAHADSINGLIISDSTGTFSLSNSKTFSVLHTITLTSTDDTSVITLPSGNKTLVATDQIFYIGTTSVTVSRASANLALTGILSVGYTNGSYTATLSPVVMTGNIALTLPALAGALVGTGDTGTVTGTMILDGTIMNAEIGAGAAISITKLAQYKISGHDLGTSLSLLTFGTGLTGISYDGSTAITIGLSSDVMLLSAIQTVTGAKTYNSQKLISTDQIINGLVSGTGVAVAASPNTLVLRDGNNNGFFDNLIEGYVTTVNAAGNTILTVASKYLQYFTGTLTQTVTLPVTSTLVLGQQFRICNNSTGLITINSSGANAIVILAGGSDVLLTCILASGTTAASWDFRYLATNITTGKMLSVTATITLSGTDTSILTLEAGAHTLASAAYRSDTYFALSGSNSDITALTNASLTLGVVQGGTGAKTLTGILKGNGTSAFSAASGTDLTALIAANYVQNSNYASSSGKVTNALTAGTGISSSGTFDGSVARTFSLDTVYLGNNYCGLIGSRRTYRMIPTTGVVNGSNTVFTWNPPTVAAIISGSEEIYVNGILFNAGATNDYTVTYGATTPFTMTVTFLTAPSNTPFVDIIMASFNV